MNSRTARFLLGTLALTTVLVLTACGSLGDTGSVRDANRLAIDCRTDEALAAVDRAAAGGGLGAGIAELQRVVILRDAGRSAEADAVMAERNARIGDPENAADSERAVEESLRELRDERQKKTGRRTCS